jgi:hypothetical protein
MSLASRELPLFQDPDVVVIQFLVSMIPVAFSQVAGMTLVRAFASRRGFHDDCCGDFLQRVLELPCLFYYRVHRLGL